MKIPPALADVPLPLQHIASSNSGLACRPQPPVLACTAATQHAYASHLFIVNKSRSREHEVTAGQEVYARAVHQWLCKTKIVEMMMGRVNQK
jgi:hypothetical protein